MNIDHEGLNNDKNSKVGVGGEGSRKLLLEFWDPSICWKGSS